MNYSATLHRFIKTDLFIISDLKILNSAKELRFWGFCLELPDLNNQKKISCIPKGIYSVQRIVSPKHGKCYEVINVPNRSNIEIHIGNFPKDILGCLAIGTDYVIAKDLSKSQLLNSQLAFSSLMLLGIESFDLNITGL